MNILRAIHRFFITPPSHYTVKGEDVLRIVSTEYNPITMKRAPEQLIFCLEYTRIKPTKKETMYWRGIDWDCAKTDQMNVERIPSEEAYKLLHKHGTVKIDL